MAKQSQNTASSSSERKVSERRLKDLRNEVSLAEGRLSKLSVRVNEIEISLNATEQNGKRKLALEKEFIVSQTGKMNATLDRLSKTHSDYIAKNERIDKERLGLNS